jgi:hypothetical protein
MDRLSKVGALSDDQKARLAKVQDFAKRFDEGAPADNISGKEAAAAFTAVTKNMNSDQFKEASAEVFAGMSAEERQAVSDLLKKAGGDQLADLDDDPEHLAQAVTQARETRQESGEGGLIESLLGQGGDAAELLNNPAVKGVLASVATVGLSKFLGSGGGLSGLIGGLLGGGDSAQGGGGGIDDLIGGLLGGAQGGDEQPPAKRNVL